MRKNLLVGVFCVIFLWPTFAVMAQSKEKTPAKAIVVAPRLLDDKASQEVYKQALDQMYNFEFDESEQIVKKVSAKYAQHPSYHLFMGLHRYWKTVLGNPHNEENFKAYRKHLYDAVKYSEAILAYDEENVEAAFFMMMAYGMLARQDADAGDYMKAMGHARKAYIYLKKGFPLKEKYDEFYFSTGLYMYYREQYPHMNPVYRPFMAFFSSGNKESGLKDMETAAEKSIFTRAEALTFLSHIYLHYENKPEKAMTFAKALQRENPKNLIFGMLYAEVMLVNGQYEAAEPFIAKFEKSEQKAYQVAAQTFRGYIAEKRDKNYKEAQTLYEKSLETGSKLRRQTDYHRAIANAGLARIAQKNGNLPLAKQLYSKANNQIYYLALRKEAEGLAQQK